MVMLSNERDNMKCKRHPLRMARGGIQWPSFQGTTAHVGLSASGKVDVYVDASMGSQAAANAKALLIDADRVVAFNDGIFGTPTGKVNVVVFALGGLTDGTGGADHMGCDYASGGNIEVCAAYGQDMRVSALFEAELSECSMGGSLCGHSTGEALSRWCAATVSGNALADFASAPAWAAGKRNWVDRTDDTDQNPESTGCGMAFLSWLMSLGHPLGDIAQDMVILGDAGTLAKLYTSLAGGTAGSAWGKFISAVAVLPGGVQSDDPFGLP